MRLSISVAAWLAIAICPSLTLAQESKPKIISPEISIDTEFQGQFSSGAHSVAFSPDNKYVVAEGVDDLAVWDLATKKRTLTLHTDIGAVTPLLIAPDGKTLIHSPHSGVTLRDFPSGENARQLKKGDGRFDAYLDNFLHRVAYSADGKLLFVGGDTRLMGFQPADGKLIFNWEGSSQEMSAMSHLFGSEPLVAVGDAEGTLHVWNLKTGKARKLDSKIKGKISTVAVSPDGKLLAAVPLYGSIEVYDVETGRQKRVLKAEGGWKPAIFLRDNVSLVYAGGENIHAKGIEHHPYVIENVEHGRRTHLLRGHTEECAFGICLSADGSKLATVSADRTIKIWDVSKLP